MVEDEELIGLFVREALHTAGFDLILLPNAEVALEQLATMQLACAIIDVGLPDLPGDELVRKIREVRPQLPIILATGYEPYHYEREFAADRWLRVLPKPFDEGRLLQELDELIALPA
jgi:DNA-binding response OmpR family regulator